MNGDGMQQTGTQPASATAHASRPAEPVRTHHDVLNLIADVEQQLERLRVAQVQSAAEFAHFADRGRRLDEREHEINAAAAMLTAREAQLRAMSEAIHDEDVRLGERHRTIEREAEACAERFRSLEERERAVAERARAIESGERAISERERDLAQRAEELAQTDALRADELASIAAEREAIAAERSAMADARAAADARLAALEAEIATLNERLAAMERERDTVGADASAQAEALMAAERNAAALMLTVTQLREQLADAESSLASRDAVVESKDQAIAERDRRVEDLERELGMAHQSLRTAGEKLATLAKSVADQAPQLERGAAAIALINEHRQRIAAQDQQIASLEARLAEAVAAASAVPTTVVDTAAIDAVSGELDAARREIERLEAEANAARAAFEAERTESAGRHGAAADAERALAATQEKVQAALGFLATRKQRIDRARRLQRERRAKREREVRQVAENAMVRVLEEERLVKKQREELRQVQEVLSATESTMMLRYARHRGGLVAAWCVIVIAGLAAGSWFAADSVVPSSSLASVDLVAKVGESERIEPEADALFQSVHREALADPGFREAVKKRLADRGVTAFKGDEFEAWLDGVGFDSDGPGSLRLVAEGPDPQVATIALDTLATTLVNESAKLAKGKGDVARATIVGNSQVPGRITFSTLVPQRGPLDRLMAAGMVFSGVMTVALVVGFVTFGRIARAKRRFEDAERFGATL